MWDGCEVWVGILRGGAAVFARVMCMGRVAYTVAEKVRERTLWFSAFPLNVLAMWATNKLRHYFQKYLF